MRDHPWFDDIALSSASRFPAVEEAAVSQVVDAYSAWSRSITTVPGPADAPESTPPGKTSSASNHAPLSQSETSPRTLQTPQDAAPKKRGKRGQDDDEDDEPPKRPAQKRQRVEDGELLLACPFQKRYHLKHFFCGDSPAIRGFTTIARVKEHIHRCHMRPLISCSRCQMVFERSEELIEHVKDYMIPSRCKERPFPDETMLERTKELQDALRRRVNRKLSLDEQWFSVWDIVFPSIDQPASCRVDDVVCAHVQELQQFISTEGENIVRPPSFLLYSMGMIGSRWTGSARSQKHFAPKVCCTKQKG